MLCLLQDIPDPLLPVDAIEGALVAILAQGNAQVVQPLLYVVSITWRWITADAARQRLDLAHVARLILVRF